MNPVKPDAPTTPGWTAVTYAKDQPEYIPLDAVRNFDQKEGPVISVWELDDSERAFVAHAIAEGRPVQISLELWTFRQPYPPMRIMVGRFPEPYQSEVQKTETHQGQIIPPEPTRPHWSDISNQPPVQDGEE